ncbi:hypothetical protein EJB05_16718, partial [Eragrostis curvula]
MVPSNELYPLPPSFCSARLNPLGLLAFRRALDSRTRAPTNPAICYSNGELAPTPLWSHGTHIRQGKRKKGGAAAPKSVGDATRKETTARCSVSSLSYVHNRERPGWFILHEPSKIKDKLKSQWSVNMSLSKAIGVISGINEFGNLFQLVKSAVSYVRSQWNGMQVEQIQEDDVLILHSELRCLSETLPAMYNLIDRAEWRIHDHCVAELLPKLKDAVYDAEDLLDDFRWYELKVVIEGKTTQMSPFIDFFSSVIQGRFNKVVDIQKRLSSLSSQLEKMGLHQTTPRFDKSVRPETTSFPTEPKIFGRQKELNELIRLLVFVPPDKRRNLSHSLGRKRTWNGSNELASSSDHSLPKAEDVKTITSVPVLPIYGIGGVGKTTLAQSIFNAPELRDQFDFKIWTCVSDDFDVKRLTKEVIQSCSIIEPTTDNLDFPQKKKTDNLDSLQHALATELNKKRFLLVLDDMWDDALQDNGQCWKRFCAPFTEVLDGSVMLVTTRSQKVAYRVCTMNPFLLTGLKDDVLWNFFKLCVFGCELSQNHSELECIGRSILPKLKGSPLAAKTLGRLLQMSLDARHWENVLKSELWEIKQEETDILPALRLSYMYLPFCLKRCFSFCAVYPKDYKFEMASLVAIWVAEGFVPPQGNIPLQRIGCQYFEDLVNRSFFQKCGDDRYVIHDLMHDMAQLVSKEECFIINNMTDIQKIPQDVRHLSILTSNVVTYSSLLSLCKHKKLRTLLCGKSLYTSGFVMDRWCSELRCIRVICASMREPIPENIGNMKHLRYLEIFGVGFGMTMSIPSALCHLYNLQTLCATNYEFENLPNDFANLINLQKFDSQTLHYHDGLTTNDAVGVGKAIRLIKNFNQLRGHLMICNLDAISEDCATEAELEMKEHLNTLTLQWSSFRSPEHNDIEVLQALYPLPRNLNSFYLDGYPGESLPIWFKRRNRQIGDHDGLNRTLFSRDSHDSGFDERIKVVHDNNNEHIHILLSSLTDLAIQRCQNLSSLEQFLQPAFLPIVKKIIIENCQSLVSLPTGKIGELHCLEELLVSHCPNVNSAGLLVPSLKRLSLINSGTIPAGNINCSSLTYMYLSCRHLTSIKLQMWSLPALKYLTITNCDSLTFIGEPERIVNRSSRHGGSSSNIGALSCLTDLTIFYCKKLITLEGLLTQEYLPAIERIHISGCPQVQSLSGEGFGSFSFLKCLSILGCPNICWQSGLVLPSSLQGLSLRNCGDFSAWFPRCLENLTSLESLELVSCECIVSIPAHLWSRNLMSLKELQIWHCPELVSVGGPDAVANIKKVKIGGCPKLKGQPVSRDSF